MTAQAHNRFAFCVVVVEFAANGNQALSKKLCVLSLVYNSTISLSAVFIQGFKFTNGQLDQKTFEVDNWASLELPTRQ